MHVTTSILTKLICKNRRDWAIFEADPITDSEILSGTINHECTLKNTSAPPNGSITVTLHIPNLYNIWRGKALFIEDRIALGTAFTELMARSSNPSASLTHFTPVMDQTIWSSPACITVCTKISRQSCRFRPSLIFVDFRYNSAYLDNQQ